MANADASGVDHVEDGYEDNIDGGIAENNIDRDEIIANNIDDTNAASSSKLNGVPSMNVDRFGFIGGDQYTDPER